MLVFISLFNYQQVYAVLEYINEKHAVNLKYSDDWKFDKDKQTEIGPELANLLNKEVDKFVIPDFNHFHLFQLVPYIENDGYESISDGNTVFSVSLYTNMSSLEDYKVYQNMTGLADTRVYTNLSSLGDKVFPNMSSLESSKVYQNMTGLADTRVYTNLSSLGDEVFPNMSSLSQ